MLGETGRSLNEQLKEHKKSLRLSNPSNSALADTLSAQARSKGGGGAVAPKDACQKKREREDLKK